MRAWLGIARRGLPLLAVGFLVDGAFLLVFLIILQTYLPESLGASQALAGYALAAFGGAKLLSQLAGGVTTDRLGMQRALIIGTAFHLAANAAILPLAHVAPSFIIGAAVLYGLGSSLTWPPLYSLAAVRFPEDERARFTAALTLATGLALLAGLGGGGLIDDYLSFDAAMMLAIGSAALAFGIACTMRLEKAELRDEDRHRRHTASLRELPNVVRSMPRIIFAVAVLAESAAIGGLAATFRAYGRDIVRVSLTREVLLLTPAAVLGCACVTLGGAAADRYSRRLLLLVGFAVSGVSLLSLSEWSALPFVAIAAAVGGAGFGLAVPSIGASMMALAGASETRGGVIGWFMSADGLGQFVGPAVAGVLIASLGPPSALRFVGLLFLAVAVITGASRSLARELS
jgi:MFS family permease